MLGLIIFLVVLCFLALCMRWRYPLFGHWLYKNANRLEAKLYGLQRRVCQVDGIDKVYYCNNNEDKPLLILIHGFSADKAVWLRIARHVNKDYHLIIPDLAGHGETGFRESWDYRIHAQSERIIQMMDVLKFEKAHFVGNSMGGFIAAHIGRYHPERTNSIVLVDPAGVKAPQSSKMDHMIANGRNPFYIDNREEFYQFFAMTMQQPPYLPKITKDALAEHYQYRKAQLKQIFEAFNQREGMLDDELQNIAVPTLILWGEKDELLHVSATEKWQRIKDSQLYIWPDLGHMPMLENPKATEKVIRSFYESLV